jgi:predicted ATPase
MVAPPPDSTPFEPISLTPVPRRGTGAIPTPTPLTALVGREQEVATLTDLLCRPDVRLITLTGPGGVGKTRLALEAIARLEPAFTDGAVFVPLAAVSEPALVASAIAQSLGVREAGGRPLVETLVSALRTKHLLLVLDNLEHLLDATPLIAQLLVASPRLSVLATSRAVLRISGEHDFPVPALTLPDAETPPMVEEVGAAPAVQLFVARAQAARPDFALFELNRGWTDGAGHGHL